MPVRESDIPILHVEDDRDLAEAVAYALAGEGFTVTSAPSLAEGFGLLTERKFELLILDIRLPDGDGLDLCRRVRRRFGVPIVFLTGFDEEVHVVRALDSGGDDYVTKPFRLKELTSRLRAVLRRANRPTGATDTLRDGPLFVDAAARRVWDGAQEVHLTATEFMLLEMLLRNREIVVVRDRLLDRLWEAGDRCVDDNSLSVYIRRLRAKIEADPGRPLRIETVRGLGYRWVGAR